MAHDSSPLPPDKSPTPNAVVHPQGHGFYHWLEGRHVRRLVSVREGLTFVDAANHDDPAQDGTAEHPWASIWAAVANAGENAVIFVRSGTYREAVALKPGQTLAGAVDLEGPLAGQVYAEERPPLIEPETLIECPAGDDGASIAAALFLPPGASARGLEIAARRPENAGKPGWTAAVAMWTDRKAARNPATTRDCVIRAEGENIRGVVLVASGQRATLRGELIGNRIRTEDEDGVFVVARNGGQTRNCVVRENDIATAGSWAYGVSVKIFGGGVHDALVLRGNTVATTGRYAYGLRADVCDRYDTEKKKQIRGLEVRDNTVHCKGQGASGIILVGHTEHGYASGESVLEACTVAGNAVKTEGGGADGVYAGSHEGVLIKNFTVQENAIVTAGANAAGIHTEAYGTQSAFKLHGNVITTKGEEAAGLYAETDFHGGLESLDARDNRIDTTGNGAAGINLALRNYVNDVYLASCALAGNTIATAGREADGVRASFGETLFGELAIEENDIATAGEHSRGVKVRLGYYDDPSGPLIVRGNTISTTGEEADAVRVTGASKDSKITEIAVQDNAIATKGARSCGLRVEMGEESRMETFAGQNNRVSTQGDDADGIFVAVGSKDGDYSYASRHPWTAWTVVLQDNDITTAGTTSFGVYTGTWYTFGEARYLGNSIATTGRDAYGLSVQVSIGMADCEARNNTVSTRGNGACGFALLLREGLRDASWMLADNTITTSGRGADGVCASSYTDCDAKLTLLDNTITTAHGNCMVSQEGWKVVRRYRRKKRAVAPPPEKGPWRYHGLRRKSSETVSQTNE